MGGHLYEIRSRRRCRSACVLKSSVGPGYFDPMPPDLPDLDAYLRA
jgi:hypothetical protein